jgi:hypothetical protein
MSNEPMRPPWPMRPVRRSRTISTSRQLGRPVLLQDVWLIEKLAQTFDRLLVQFRRHDNVFSNDIGLVVELE